MAALHPLGALGTMADMHIELGDDRTNRRRNVGLILCLHRIFRDAAAAVRTLGWQGCFEFPANAVGFGAMRGAMADFLAGFLGRGFECAIRERRRLAFATPSGLIQLLF